MNLPSRSLPPSYFDQLYATQADPWEFETSEYEASKYAATLAALPKPRYRSAFEIGGSIGVLTEKLADRCDALLSVDVAAIAQAKAIQRCQSLNQVQFQIMQIPDQFPDQQFDLILVSEVGYYLSWEDLHKAQSQILNHLDKGGHLLLVHWILEQNYPLSGDEVHESFLKLAPPLRLITAQRTPQYRLDLFEKIAEV